jgi:hypothetical protein
VGTPMFDPIAKRPPKLAWAGASNLPLFPRLLIISACALASWAAVILLSLGLLRLLGY